jgi:hypothetical protein
MRIVRSSSGRWFRDSDIHDATRAVSNIGRMTVAQKVVFPWLAVMVTVAALLFATLALGPLVRALFGVPVGFNEDFTSPAAYDQALFVQAISVGIGFLIFGGAIGKTAERIGFRQALWVVNPITVGVGFAAYKWIYHSLRRPDYLPDYDSPSIFALFVITAPLLFASCLFAGDYLRKASARNYQ